MLRPTVRQATDLIIQGFKFKVAIFGVNRYYLIANMFNRNYLSIVIYLEIIICLVYQFFFVFG